MKRNFILLFVLAVPGFLSAQGKFSIEFTAPSYVNDSIIFAPSPWVKELTEIYNVNVETGKSIKDFGKESGLGKTFYQITVQEKNMINGELDYPMPFTFQTQNRQTGQIYVTSRFFLDSGHYKIALPRFSRFDEINLNSSVNEEYAGFKKLFADLYVTQEQRLSDSLTNLAEKEKRIGAYIKKHPESYVALWEIFDDYCNYDYYPIYLENLRLFSGKMSTNRLFKTFENKLKLDSANEKGNKFELEKTLVEGSEFPEIAFDEHNVLTAKDFKNYTLTFIDCWATGCGSCLKEMPEIVAMYGVYKDEGVNFISVTAETDPKRIELAKKILKKNNVQWTNYFDIKKNFEEKVGLTEYPLHFLVDRDGKIVARVNGADLNSIKKAMDDYLRNEKNE